MKTIKIFISSTFKDMNAERDMLIKKVFPGLKEKAENELGVRIQEIDLRWGVTEEDIKRGGVVDLCLSGIDECRPYFLCMLGKRYGWIPAPLYIEQERMAAALTKATLEEALFLRTVYPKSDDTTFTLDLSRSEDDKEKARAILERYGIKEAGQSITEQEIEHVLDENAIPRQIEDLNRILEDSSAQLDEDGKQLVRSAYVRQEDDNWYLKAGIPEADRRRLAGILRKIGAAAEYHNFFFIREDCGENHTDYIETEDSRKQKLSNLKKTIEQSTDGKYFCTTYPCSWNPAAQEGAYPIQNLDVFGKKVSEILWEHIAGNPEQTNLAQEKTGLELEEYLQSRAEENKTYDFCGREDLLDLLQGKIQDAFNGKLLNEDSKKTSYILLTGEHGSGKSSLLAKLCENMRNSQSFRNCLVIRRFAGATERSAVIRDLVDDFCSIIQEEIPFDEMPSPGYDELQLILGNYPLFDNLLKNANQRIVLVLDAADQLLDVSCSKTMWLPKNLPDNICFVISHSINRSGDDTRNAEFLDSMRKWATRPVEIPVTELMEQEKSDMIRNNLKKINKNISKDQISTIISKKDSVLPLFLRTALEELRAVRGHEELPYYFSNVLTDDIHILFDRVLDRLENEFDDLFDDGKGLFHDVLKWIAISKNGIHPLDLRLLLGRWHEVKPAATWEEKKRRMNEIKIDDYRWSEIKRCLRSFITYRGENMVFFNKSFKNAVIRKTNLDKETIRKEAHKTMAAYFTAIGPDYPNTLELLPWHLFQSDSKNELIRLLTEYSFIKRKVDAGMLDGLIDDFNRMKIDRTLRLLHESLILSYSSISVSGESLNVQLYGRLLGYKEKEPAIRNFLDQITAYSTSPWLMPRKCSLIPPDNMLVRSFEEQMDYFSEVRIPSSGDKLIATFSEFCTIKVWDLHSGFVLTTITDPIDVKGIGIDKNGEMAITGGTDGCIAVWDLIEGAKTKEIQAHLSGITGVCLTEDGNTAVTASTDCTVKIWDVRTFQETAVLKEHDSPIRKICMTPDGKRAVSASDDGRIICWDLAAKRPIHPPRGYRGAVNEISITADGRTAAFALNDSTIRIWDLDTGKETAMLTGHAGRITGLSLSSDGRKLASSSGDLEVKIWDMEKKCEWMNIGRHAGAKSVLFTPDGEHVVSVSSRSIQLWNLKKHSAYDKNDHGLAVSHVRITPDGKKVISASRDFSVKVWDIDSIRQPLLVPIHTDLINSISVTPDSKKAVSASGNTLFVWDLSDGRIAHILNGHTDEITCVIITPNGSRIISASRDKTLIVWDLPEGKKLHVIKGHTNDIKGISLLPDENILASIDDDGYLKIWNINTGKLLKSYETEHKGGILSMSASLDRKTIITSSADYIITIWRFDEFIRKTVIYERVDNLFGAELTLDGKYLVSASGRYFKIIDLQTLKTVAILKKDNALIAFSPDSMIMAYNTLSQKNTLVLYDLENKNPLCKFTGDAGTTCSAIHSSGDVAIGDISGNIAIFKLQNHSKNRVDPIMGADASGTELPQTGGHTSKPVSNPDRDVRSDQCNERNDFPHDKKQSGKGLFMRLFRS